MFRDEDIVARGAVAATTLTIIDDSETEYLIERLDRAIQTVEARHQQRPPA
ncbi:hypothetical protein ACFTWF_43625 [Rhodococcus sp. NPDC056960]|uniref:hypothetical protein n=1 Tax=Rhodococcus sp. NPDC056960 TaxID=3345982 RepID=UPI003624DD97